ncbi:MAG: LysM peptidoglycan-binding domain-containing protein, partial [Synergistaceae bacterium]|nr:LysM peptidoglycan-binding domain-containing protein [Synergistaceae bacterium]
MKAGDDIRKTKRRKTLCLIIFLMAAVGSAVVFAAKAAEHTGMYWIGPDSEFVTERPEYNRCFFTVDVSDFLNNTGAAPAAADEEETEIVPLAIGPLPSIPTLTDKELKLYGILSKNDGRISSSDQSVLDEDIHWTEVVLEPGDTLKSIADEFGISEEDLRQANGLRKNEKPNPAEVLYVPDSHNDVTATLLFARKLQKEELAITKKGKLLETSEYIVKEGDTLWGISGKFNLDVDTLVGSNQKVLGGNINRLKLGMALRIPNQDGIFVKVAKRD